MARVCDEREREREDGQVKYDRKIETGLNLSI